ncbi:MAG: hypothetical protein IBJ03_06775 [Gemmatimonadaceae bacterium]|nr:hypothetical protein [Gemmatimonadaceae bacterium]
MIRRRILVAPIFLSAFALFAAPAVPDALGGPRLHAMAEDCWFKWLADAQGTIYCKEDGRNCHAACPGVE